MSATSPHEDLICQSYVPFNTGNGGIYTAILAQ